MTGSAARVPTDRGSGLLGTAAGFLVFLMLMFAATQVLFDLYATSMVTSAAHDAARVVAGFDNAADRCGATVIGDRVFSDALGAYSTETNATLTWTCSDPDAVRVRVVADHPTVLPQLLVGLTGLGHIDRTIVVRAEQLR
jgi:hypothetical protein